MYFDVKNQSPLSYLNKHLARSYVNYIMGMFSLISCLLLPLAPQAFASDSNNEVVSTKSANKFLTADEAFAPTFSQNGEEVTVTFKIAPKYYLYQEIMSISGENIELSKVDIPNGTPHQDEYMGDTHIYTNEVSLKAVLKNTDFFPKLKVTYQGCTTGLCYPPITKSFNLSRITSKEESSKNLKDATSKNISTKDAATNLSASIDNSTSISRSQGTSSQNTFTNQESLEKGATDEAYTLLKKSNLIIALFSFFGFGFLLSLTPCMFPMYPIWSAIILGKKERNLKRTVLFSFLYTQGLALTYMIVGFVIASAGARFHAFMQQPWVLLIMSALFILIALSCFGMFSLSLPLSLQNKLNNTSAKLKGGSYIGVFLMGAISAIIASPCTTAPLAGALLYIAQEGNTLIGGISLYILALGMSVPLFIIAFAGHKFLPKSGNWMTTVRIMCGFLMLIVPLVLLENMIPPNIIKCAWIILIGAAVMCLVYRLFPLNLGASISSNNNSQNNNVPDTTRKPIVLRTISLVLVALATIALCVVLYSPAPVSGKHFPKINTLNEINTITQNMGNSELVVIDFRADWCRECAHMDKTTFSDPRVIKALSRGLTYQADVTSPESPAQEIMLHYKLSGVPAIVIFKKNLPSPIILNGYTGPDDLLKELEIQ